MKKMLTRILVFTVVLSIILLSALTANAQTLTDEGYSADSYLSATLMEPPEEPTEIPAQPKFRNNFEHYCYFNFYVTVDHYNELYYHYTDDGELDWVLVQGLGYRERPALLYRIVGNRLLSNSSCFIPFDGTMGVYDVAKRIYYDVTDDMLNRYDGLADVYMEMGIGRLIGDIDRDDELSIIDATIMQRCEAKSMDYPADDEVEYRNSDDQLRYYSDFNRDGERDILDATCIQRYLTNLPFTVGA